MIRNPYRGLRAIFTMTALVVSGLSAGAARADFELLANPGFESGSLTPWFQASDFGGTENWNVTSAVSNSGTFSATDVGNKELQQNFAATATSSITSVTFFAEHPDATVTLLAYDFLYTDGSDQEFFVNTVGTGFNSFDVTAQLDPSKTLDGFAIFGNSGGRTYFDDASIKVKSVPEPTSLALMALGGVALRFASRRRRTGTDAAQACARLGSSQPTEETRGRRATMYRSPPAMPFGMDGGAAESRNRPYPSRLVPFRLNHDYGATLNRHEKRPK